MVKRALPWMVLLALIFFFLVPAGAAQTRRPSEGSSLWPGFTIEYFSRTLSWQDLEEDATSKMKAILATLALGYEIQEGFSLTLLAGYASSNFDGLVFRRLPFSIDYEAGGISGLVFGGEIDKAVMTGETYGLDIYGQFLGYFGLAKRPDWPADFVVDGTLEGKPNWMRVSVGPVLSYGRGKVFSPYLYPNFNYLWGTFELAETVEDLEGKEKKEIKAKSLFGLALGADFKLTSRLRLRYEAGIYPHKGKGGADYTFTVKTLFAL
ncbi:MAG: hypothetical protein AB1715_10790 [Acidobacteriota bacterium]